MRRSLMAQQARVFPERPAALGDAARIYTRTRGMHNTFELVFVACCSYDVFASASRKATCAVFSRLLLYPWTVFDVITNVQPRWASQGGPPPPIPPLPPSSYISPQDSRPPIGPISFPSHRTTSPTSSIHSRSLPVPLPLSTQPPVPPVPIMANPRPGASTPRHPLPQGSESFTHLRGISTLSESRREYNLFVKLPPNYSSVRGQTSSPLPPPTRTPAERGVWRIMSSALMSIP